MMSRPLQLEGVTRAFGAVVAVDGITLSVSRGEFVAIVGPSGCGKTTLLNLFSGDDRPTAGAIVREGRVRMVFQQDGLFPWLTVAENISLGLRDLKDERERGKQIVEMIR